MLKRQIAKNSGSNWAYTVTIAVVGVVLVPVMLSRLGTEAYGVWALFTYGLSYPTLLNMAFMLATNRFVAFHQNDITKVNRVVSTSFVILLALGLLVMVGMTVLAFFVSAIFTAIPAELGDAAQVTCILVGATLAFKIFEASFAGALKGYHYFVAYNSVLITSAILRAVLILGFLSVWRSIVAVQVGCAIAAAASTVLMFVVSRRRIVGLKISPRLVNTTVLRSLFRYMIHSTMRLGSRLAMHNILVLLLGWKGTAIDVTVYTIASKLPRLLVAFVGGVQGVFLPIITNFCADKRFEKIKEVVIKGTHACSTLTCFSSIVLFVFVEEILRFWLGANVPEGTVRVMRMLIVAFIPGGFFEVWLPACIGVGYLRALTVAAVVTTLAAIAIELALFYGISVSPMAPAIALVVVLWVKVAIWLPLYGVHKFNIGLWEYFRIGLMRSILAGIASLAVLWVVGNILPKREVNWLVRFVVSCSVVMTVFGFITLRKELVRSFVLLCRRIGIRRGYEA